MFLALPDLELILRNIHRSEGRCSPNSLFTSFTVWDFPYAPLLRAFKKTMNAPFPEEGYTGKCTFASTAVVAPIDDKFFLQKFIYRTGSYSTDYHRKSSRSFAPKPD